MQIPSRGLAIKNIPKITLFSKGIYAMHHFFQVNLLLTAYSLSSPFVNSHCKIPELNGKGPLE